MANATDRKHPHLISIRGDKELEDALVALAVSEGLTKYEMLRKIVEHYVECVPAEKVVEEKTKTIAEGRESALRSLQEAARKAQEDKQRGRRPAEGSKAAVA